jgi:flagellar motor switch protein FliN/FliY
VSQTMKGPEAAAAITRHFENALASALSSMTGKDFTITANPASEAEELAEAMIWRQVFSFSGDPTLWLMAGKGLWTTAGQLTLAAVGIDSLTDEDCRSTWMEITGQTMGAFAAALSGDLQHEITAGKGEETEASPDNLNWIPFSAAADGEAGWVLQVAWSPLLSALYDPPAVQEKPSGAQNASFSKTFDLLLDVALPVSVSFGRTSLQIREVLKLNTGSIVELNRFVAEPVDVIVNDCVIARGEVVVVDGNYGVRITQLSSREDRLRTGMMDSPVRVGEPLR